MSHQVCCCWTSKGGGDLLAFIRHGAELKTFDRCYQWIQFTSDCLVEAEILRVVLCPEVEAGVFRQHRVSGLNELISLLVKLAPSEQLLLKD